MACADIEDDRIALSQRCIDIGVTFEMKPKRRYSDDCVIHPVQRYGLAEDLRAAIEPMYPQTIADDDYWRSSVLILVRRKITPEGQLYAQGVEEA